MFYGPTTHFRSFRARAVNLSTLFLGKLPMDKAVYQYFATIKMKQVLAKSFGVRLSVLIVFGYKAHYIKGMVEAIF